MPKECIAVCQILHAELIYITPNTLPQFLCDECMYEDLKPFFYFLAFEKEQIREICDKYSGRMSFLVLAPRFKSKCFFTFLMKERCGLYFNKDCYFCAVLLHEWNELQLILIRLSLCKP